MGRNAGGGGRIRVRPDQVSRFENSVAKWARAKGKNPQEELSRLMPAFKGANKVGREFMIQRYNKARRS